MRPLSSIVIVRVVLLVCLLIPIVCNAGQILLDTDTFGGANGDALSTYSANWPRLSSPDLGLITIQTTPGFGQANPDNGLSAHRRTGQTWTDNQWGEAIIGSPVNGIFGIMVRSADEPGNGVAYLGGYFPTTGDTIYKIVRLNSDTSLAYLVVDPGSHTAASDDIVNFEAVGTVLRLRVTRSAAPLADFTYDTVGDTPIYTTGDPGLFEWHTTGPIRAGGTWRAGSVTPDTRARRTLMGVGQ